MPESHSRCQSNREKSRRYQNGQLSCSSLFIESMHNSDAHFMGDINSDGYILSNYVHIMMVGYQKMNSFMSYIYMQLLLLLVVTSTLLSG